jgi:hypothetical protein
MLHLVPGLFCAQAPVVSRHVQAGGEEGDVGSNSIKNGLRESQSRSKRWRTRRPLSTQEEKCPTSTNDVHERRPRPPLTSGKLSLITCSRRRYAHSAGKGGRGWRGKARWMRRLSAESATFATRIAEGGGKTRGTPPRACVPTGCQQPTCAASAFHVSRASGVTQVHLPQNSWTAVCCARPRTCQRRFAAPVALDDDNMHNRCCFNQLPSLTPHACAGFLFAPAPAHVVSHSVDDAFNVSSSIAASA